MQARETIRGTSVHFVVGNLITGRLLSEHTTFQQAHDRLVHMTDRTGYEVYSRFEWETKVPEPYEEAKYVLEKIISDFDDLTFDDAARVMSANPVIKHRIRSVAETLLQISETRRT